MVKYFLIHNTRLVKGYVDNEKNTLIDRAFEYKQHQWVEIDRNEVNDRLMGYDPTEDSYYGIGNIDIMNSIQIVSEEQAQHIQSK